MAEQKVARKWYSGMLTTEDWWAVWIGLFMVALGLFSLVGLDLTGWVAAPNKWVDPSKGVKVAGKAWAFLTPIGSLIVSYIIFTILVTIGAACMKWNLKKFIAAWTSIYVITWLCWYFGHHAHIAAMSTQLKKYDITWSLNMGGGGSYLLALIVGLIIGNFFKGFANFLKDAAKPEWFIKTAIVFLGVKLGEKSMEAGGYAFELAVTGAAATIVAYMLFWPIVYTLARKGFKMNRHWAACLASGVSICGVSASVATAGAIRAKTFIPVVVAILVVVCTIFMIVGLPPLYSSLFMNEPMVAGSAVGMTVKTDGGDAATGAILEEMMWGEAHVRHMAGGPDAETWNWDKGWILNAAIMTKIWIDMFIGIWAFVLAIIWVNKVEKSPGQSRVPASEIWFRFPKFVIGYILAWFIYVAIGLATGGSDAVIEAAKVGSKPVSGTMRHLFFMLTFTAIGAITDFRKMKGIGRPALVYAIAQFIIIPPIALLIAWIFHNGMMPPAPLG